ncbi:hypothetical protein [Oerskovia merdavium]|uniref:Integral membrane protein n=1 Tax=Oerskovia merdavium TaxID=2762227 RepID=A0ABR8U1Y0_9CELL|nr:hypothetical protein [Oerskovia merdavium]MBD7982043.1 hypothetical protein [Oerskovia merdavium]
MAWWEDEKPSLADQLADSSRPTRSASRYTTDHSRSWGSLPLWLLLGTAITVVGGAVLWSSQSAVTVCLGVTVLALGLFYLSQYGVLAFYALQVGRLRDRRTAAALAHESVPALTDDDVRQFHVPVRPSFAGPARLGLLDPGEGPTPPAMRVARIVGGSCTAVFMVGAVATIVAGWASRS